MKKQRNTLQTKEQDKIPEIEISDLPEREFKITLIMMITEVRTVREQSENFNKETGNLRKYQIETRELKNILIELKNSIEGFKNRLDEEELEDRAVEFIQLEQQKEKRI